MYDGKVIGNKYFDLKEARLRMFGGSSNHWEELKDFSDRILEVGQSRQKI